MNNPFILSTLFTHECKVSTMHFKIKRMLENNEIVFDGSSEDEDQNSDEIMSGEYLSQVGKNKDKSNEKNGSGGKGETDTKYEFMSERNVYLKFINRISSSNFFYLTSKNKHQV